MTAVSVGLIGEGGGIRGKTVACYTDNNNALRSIVKNSGATIDIQEFADLIWRRIRDLGSSPWFGRVPSKRNIADLNTRYVKMPYVVK